MLETLTISSCYVAIFIILQFVFTLLVRVRRSERISLGHGNNSTLERRMRAHGNFTEVVPITLIALVLLELNAGNALLLHTLGALFLLFRLMHYIGVAFASTITLRFYGMVGTAAVMVAAAIALLLSVF